MTIAASRRLQRDVPHADVGHEHELHDQLLARRHASSGGERGRLPDTCTPWPRRSIAPVRTRPRAHAVHRLSRQRGRACGPRGSPRHAGRRRHGLRHLPQWHVADPSAERQRQDADAHLHGDAARGRPRRDPEGHAQERHGGPRRCDRLPAVDARRDDLHRRHLGHDERHRRLHLHGRRRDPRSAVPRRRTGRGRSAGASCRRRSWSRCTVPPLVTEAITLKLNGKTTVVTILLHKSVKATGVSRPSSSPPRS